MIRQWNVLGDARPNTGRTMEHVVPFWAVLPTPNPILGSCASKLRFGRILGYVAQIAIPRALFPGTTPPLLVVSTPQNGPNTPLDPSLGSFGLRIFLYMIAQAV